jgi:hypothetical protein
MKRYYPEGYLEAERKFTKYEWEAFHNKNEDEKERLREDIMVKRRIFQKYWEVKHNIKLGPIL